MHYSLCRSAGFQLNPLFPPGQDTFVGIFAQNSVAWHSTMQMCNHYSMVLVPLYDTLGEQAVQVRNVLKY